jgi:hypothetical protein
MMWRELSDTLIELVQSLQPPAEAGVVVTEAEIELPLEVHSGLRGGSLVFYAAPPHTRWKSGIMPGTQPGKLHVQLIDDEVPEARDAV